MSLKYVLNIYVAHPLSKLHPSTRWQFFISDMAENMKLLIEQQTHKETSQ